MTIDINCDMGEGFSIYRCGDDKEIMPHVTRANVACGFHASDPSVMRETVRLAKSCGVRVGAHPSYPDLQGFGRRYMKMGREELTDALLYQVGALKAFLDAEDVPLSHLKPHGALYGAACREEEVAVAVADAARVFGVPLLGMSGTLHETVYPACGVEVIFEVYVDLDYDDSGHLIITREHEPVSPALAAERARRALRDGVVRSIHGKKLPFKVDSICVHSDTPDAIAVARSVRALDAEAA